MIEVEQEARKRVERALIVGVSAGNEDPGRVHVHLDELAELLGNLDIAVVGRAVAKLKGPAHAQFYVGTGKAEEIAAMVEELDADVLSIVLFPLGHLFAKKNKHHLFLR